MTHVLNWNGKDVPAELRKLRPGRYIVEEADKAPKLTAAQEAGLAVALKQLERGEGIPAEQVHTEMTALIKAHSKTRRLR
jgi:hypothetical protein